MPQSISSNQKSPSSVADAENCTFHGIGQKGNFKFIYNGRKRIGVGTLYRLEEATGTDGRSTTFRRVVHKSAQKLSRRECDVSVSCSAHDDATPMRFVGRFLKSHQKGAHETGKPQQAKGTDALCVGQHVQRSPNLNSFRDAADVSIPASVKIIEAKEETPIASTRKNTYLISQGELLQISAARTAELDVDLKIQVVCFLVGESRASVLRKVKGGAFPQPKKRGRSSFWSLLEIDAYRSGTWDPLSI